MANFSSQFGSVGQVNQAETIHIGSQQATVGHSIASHVPELDEIAAMIRQLALPAEREQLLDRQLQEARAAATANDKKGFSLSLKSLNEMLGGIDGAVATTGKIIAKVVALLAVVGL